VRGDRVGEDAAGAELVHDGAVVVEDLLGLERVVVGDDGADGLGAGLEGAGAELRRGPRGRPSDVGDDRAAAARRRHHGGDHGDDLVVGQQCGLAGAAARHEAVGAVLEQPLGVGA
jgi:hypothetical protein